ncbi:MAG: helix-turn-helix domain-containing protein [Bacilli bacterium]|jgi:transposase
MKYTFKFKLECVNKYKNGVYIKRPGICRSSRDTFIHKVRNWVALYDRFGIEGLKRRPFNKDWTKDDRFKLVAQVLSGKVIRQVALDNGISDGQLSIWVRKYREKGIDGLECHKGRPHNVPTMPKKKKVKLAPSEKEELELLRARNEYLEAENIYLKKLDALVTKREAAHPKAKKQKLSKK